MTVEVEYAGHRSGEHHAVSGAVIGALITAVHAHGGDGSVAQTLALAGDRRPFSDLADPSLWSSLHQTVALFNAAALVTGDGAVGVHVGEALLHPAEASEFVDRLASLGATDTVLKHVAPLVDHFEQTSDAVALEVASGHALIRISPRDAPHRHAHLCELTRGLLASVPTLFGGEPALVSEHECSARGGRYCLYSLSWDGPDRNAPEEEPAPAEGGDLLDGDDDQVPPPGPGQAHERRAFGFAPGSRRADNQQLPRAALGELQYELDRLEVLAEGASATASELLGDDLEPLLSQIASRADAVVSSLTYLLMVRIRPGTPIQLHYRGLVPDEAQALAAELWAPEPDDAGGTRLIVDIASSRRHYGRLVEFLPPGGVPPRAESRILRHYAGYAATTLDVFGVLADARRSDATARTLLSFAEALSRVTAVPELVQLLADTVPSVTGCDQSTVYLWDSGEGALRPSARTSGLQPPDADLGSGAADREPGRSVNGSVHGHEEGREGTVVERDAEDPVLVNGYVAGVTVSATDAAEHPGDAGSGPVAVRTDDPLVVRMMEQREVMVIDQSTADPYLRRRLDWPGTAASVIAPLFAAGEFLGVVAADYGSDTSPSSSRDGELHERLRGLADQAATALQNLSLLEKVSHMAWHDALTGLPNRRLFEDRVEQELVRSRRVGEPVCMFFVDLDHFKSINDTLGHGAGDDLIQQVARRLVDTVRRQDTVARVGGDEFAILLPGLSDQVSIDQLAQRSLEAMSSPFVVFGEDVETSASIGIAMAPDHGDSYDELLSRADEAMYRAKARGRNAFQMYSGPPSPDPDDADHAVDDRSLAADLVDALEHDEFFVLYQPYIDLRTSQVVGVEALVRWRHPTLGVLEPSAFISVAERNEVIVAIDSWVLEETCRQARAWLDQGLRPLRLSVNLASRDLSDPDLFDHTERALAASGLDPTLLELEITKRVVLDKGGPARENIDRLRRLGVRFTIDNFGTGNSSLSRIGAFPVSTLKIDNSFVQVLAPDGENDALVTAIITMAHRLGLECVAEGVETSLQSRVLLQRGCTTAQGYFFSPPLPPEEILAMMTVIATADDRVVLGDGLE
ncbi:MAG: EAL domain-containing protein [Acidimicrobiales bacterium]